MARGSEWGEGTDGVERSRSNHKGEGGVGRGRGEKVEN